MRFKIFSSEEFEDNIFEIEYYYRNFESDNRAEKVLKSIKECVSRISNSPEEFPFENESIEKTIRKAVIHHTFILHFKIISTDSILLLGIIHGKMNII